jgi:CHRD domain
MIRGSATSRTTNTIPQESFMPITSTFIKTGIATAVFALAACSSMSMGGGESITLSGANEVPAVSTSASAKADVKVAADGAVSGTVTTTGMTPTAAHIHMGAAGANGPVIVPMVQSGDVFTFPAGSKLSETQLAAYKAGNTYVNVHSAKNPGGEIRAQLKGS